MLKTLFVCFSFFLHNRKFLDRREMVSKPSSLFHLKNAVLNTIIRFAFETRIEVTYNFTKCLGQSCWIDSEYVLQVLF